MFIFYKMQTWSYKPSPATSPHRSHGMHLYTITRTHKQVLHPNTSSAVVSHSSACGMQPLMFSASHCIITSVRQQETWWHHTHPLYPWTDVHPNKRLRLQPKDTSCSWKQISFLGTVAERHNLQLETHHPASSHCSNTPPSSPLYPPILSLRHIVTYDDETTSSICLPLTYARSPADFAP